MKEQVPKNVLTLLHEWSILFPNTEGGWSTSARVVVKD